MVLPLLQSRSPYILEKLTHHRLCGVVSGICFKTNPEQRDTG